MTALAVAFQSILVCNYCPDTCDITCMLQTLHPTNLFLQMHVAAVREPLHVVSYMSLYTIMW